MVILLSSTSDFVRGIEVKVAPFLAAPGRAGARRAVTRRRQPRRRAAPSPSVAPRARRTPQNGARGCPGAATRQPEPGQDGMVVGRPTSAAPGPLDARGLVHRLPRLCGDPGFFYGLYRGIKAVWELEGTLRRERIRKELERDAASPRKGTHIRKRRASTVEKLLGQDEMTRLQTAFAWGPAAAFWWTARRTIVETDLCAPGAFFFAVFPPYCGWARSTQTLFLTSFFAVTITLIGYTSVKFAECLEFMYEKSYGLHRLWSHFSRLVHRQRPALMCVCVLLGNIAAHRFPLLPADRYCGHGSTFLHTRLCRSSTVWCALPAGHLLWGSHLRFSCANGGSANTWHCLSLLLGTLKYSLILQAAYALCESVLYASEDVPEKTREAQAPTHRGGADPGLPRRRRGRRARRARRSSCGAGDGCRVCITGTAAQVAAAKKLVQEACAAGQNRNRTVRVRVRVRVGGAGRGQASRFSGGLREFSGPTSIRGRRRVESITRKDLRQRRCC